MIVKTINNEHIYWKYVIRVFVVENKSEEDDSLENCEVCVELVTGDQCLLMRYEDSSCAKRYSDRLINLLITSDLSGCKIYDCNGAPVYY